MRIFVTGDSHTGALKRGLAQLRASGSDDPSLQVDVVGLGSGTFFVQPFFQEREARVEITEPSLRRHVSQLPLPGPEGAEMVYCWSGLFHFARVWRNSCWIRSRPAFHPGPGAPVSEGLVRETVLQWFQYQLGILDALRRCGATVVAVESPRPFRHHHALRLIRPDVVVAVDRFCQKVMLQELQSRSLPLIRIPEECVDGDGFMLPRWRHEREKDPHHGNAEFGALMIGRIHDYFRGLD